MPPRFQRTEDKGRMSANSQRATLNHQLAALAAWKPGVFLPESLEGDIVAAKNVALCFSKIGNAGWIGAARTQTAFAVAGVLPQVPTSPGRGGPWFGVIIGDPKPAVGKNGAMRGGCAASVQHLAQTIFAGVDPGIFSSALFDPFNERDRLRDAHRAARVMAVLFEIEHQQHASAAFFRIICLRDRRMRRTDDGEEMIGLRNWIRAVTEMIRAPQQTSLRRGGLSLKISPVALQARKCRFVNDADDAFVFHSDEIGVDQIVVRHVHDAVTGKCGKRQKRKHEETASVHELHARKIMGEIRNANFELRRPHLNPLPNKREEEQERVRSPVASQQLNVSNPSTISRQAFAVRLCCRQDPVHDRVHGVSTTVRCRARAR